MACRVLGCSRRSSHSCRQVEAEVEVVGLYSPGCKLPGCRVAGCNSAVKWGEKPGLCEIASSAGMEGHRKQWVHKRTSLVEAL